MKSAKGYRSWRFQIFLFFSSGGHFVYWSGTILAILVGSHLGNIPVKSESHWPKGLADGSTLSKLFTLFFYFLALAAILFT